MSHVALGMRIWSLVAYQSSHKEAWRRAEPGGKPTGKPIPQPASDAQIFVTLRARVSRECPGSPGVFCHERLAPLDRRHVRGEHALRAVRLGEWLGRGMQGPTRSTKKGHTCGGQSSVASALHSLG
jgi:hypothetical protein